MLSDADGSQPRYPYHILLREKDPVQAAALYYALSDRLPGVVIDIASEPSPVDWEDDIYDLAIISDGPTGYGRDLALTLYEEQALPSLVLATDVAAETTLPAQVLELPKPYTPTQCVRAIRRLLGVGY